MIVVLTSDPWHYLHRRLWGPAAPSGKLCLRARENWKEHQETLAKASIRR